MFSGFIASTYKTKYKKKKHWLFKSTNFLTFAQGLMFHACMEVQKPRFCGSCSCLLRTRVALEEIIWGFLEKQKDHPQYIQRTRHSVLYLHGETIQFKVLENTRTINRRFNNEFVTIENNWTTALLHGSIKQSFLKILRYLSIYL